jgi:hypothetical protein
MSFVQPQRLAVPLVVISYVAPNSKNSPDESQKTQYEYKKQNTHGNLLKNNKRDCGLPWNPAVALISQSPLSDRRKEPLQIRTTAR